MLRRFAMLLFLVGLLLAAAACAPSAAPTPTPTKAAPAVAPTAAPKVEATKPAEKPAATPTAAPSKPTGAPIKLGFVTPLSGPMTSLGVLQRIAGKLAEEDVNATGGINGAPLQLVIEDSPFDPKQAVTVLRKLAEQDRVFAVVGPFSSAEFDSAAPLSNDLKLAVVTGSGMKVGVAASNRPYSFMVSHRGDITFGPAIDVFKRTFPNVKRVVLTGDTKEAVTEYMVRNRLPTILKEKGLEIIDTVALETRMTDFSAVVTKIKELNPEGVVLSALQPEAINFAKEYQRQGMKAPVVTSVHVMGGSLAELAGDSIEGWIIPGFMDYENTDPAVQNFTARFFKAAEADQAVRPKPSIIVTEGVYYDTVMALAEIMRKAGVKADMPLQQARDAIRDGLQNLRGYKGVNGTITMPASGELEREPQTVVTAEKGKWKNLWKGIR